jgi:peptidoglycan/LPS O-acetylase OafA/YrhL
MGAPAFPSFLEMPARVSLGVWRAIRALSVASALALCVALVVRPGTGLFFFWKIVVPILPLVFLVAPGLWRNVCPLAASNQTPRLLGLGRAGTPPPGCGGTAT